MDDKFVRSDIALIKKRTAPEASTRSGDEPNIWSRAVNTARNIKLDDDAREVEAPKEKEFKMPDWDAYKKLNKKDREKALARAKAASLKADADADKVRRDQATGRALE